MNDPTTPEALQRAALAELDALLTQSASEREAHLATLAQTRPQLHGLVRQLLAYEQRVEQGFMEPKPRAQGGLRPDLRLGPYRILSLLGEGGMGEVWLARRDDGLYEGQVAIKTLHPYFAGGALRERFLREAQVLGRLAHANIAKLLDAGIHEGVVYLVLEYVVGRPLDKACDQEQLDIRARLGIFLQLCAAVAHAHSSLVVHRDIKPGNVLLTADGVPKLLDFGIASLIEPERAGLPSDVTRQVGRSFTPEYAAPEQVLGQEITTATDVHALGVLLYLLLAGRLPYRAQGENAGESLSLEQAVLNAEPPRLLRALEAGESELLAGARSTPLARLRRELSGDLENIVQKALQKRPQDRYPTVVALADDVRRYLNGEPVQARAGSSWYRLRKFARRNRILVGAAAAVLLALSAGLAISLWQLEVARAERRHAQEVTDFVGSIFRSADPFFTGRSEMSAAELLTLARERIDRELQSKPLVAAELLNIVGESQTNLDQSEAAEVTLRKALAIAESARPRDEVLIAAAQYRLAAVGSAQRDPATAVALLEQALPVLRRHMPKTALLYAGALQNRATEYHEEGNWDQAIPLQREAIAVLDVAFGGRNSETIMARRTLALYLVLTRQYEEARPLLEQGLRDIVATSSPGERLAVMQLLESTYARLLLDSGDLQAGIVHLDKALTLATQAWGPGSDPVIVARSQLALAQIRQGDLDAAIATARLGYDLKTPSQKAARALANHGRYLLAARRVPESIEILRQSVELLKAHDPGKGSWLSSTQSEYGTALALSGRFAESKALLEANLLLARESGLPNSVPVALNALGQWYQLNLRWQDSEPLFREALTYTTGKELIQKPRAEALGGLGSVQLVQGNAAEAESLFRQADEAAAQTYLNLIPLRADLQMQRGRALLQQGKTEAAREILERVHEYWQRFDAQGRGAAAAAYWLAQLRQAQGRHQEAQWLWRRALEGLSTSPLPGDASWAREARRQLTAGAER